MQPVTPIRLRVGELRTAKGWTQEQLAQRAGVSRVTISRIESDENRRIDYDVLEKLADALEVDAGFLIVHDRDTKRGRKS
jgi:transcriptional regulator with XRE-family HTH domain